MHKTNYVTCNINNIAIKLNFIATAQLDWKIHLSILNDADSDCNRMDGLDTDSRTFFRHSLSGKSY